MQQANNWHSVPYVTGWLFPRKRYRFIWFGRSSGLLVSAPSSHVSMATHSDVKNWASTIELTAAGLRRTLTGFPLGALVGRPNRLQKYKINLMWQNFFTILILFLLVNTSNVNIGIGKSGRKRLAYTSVSSVTGVLFPRKRYRFHWFGRSSGLLCVTLPSHAPMAAYSGLKRWVTACELTAAGLRRILTCFPLGTLVGRPNRRQKYK